LEAGGTAALARLVLVFAIAAVAHVWVLAATSLSSVVMGTVLLVASSPPPSFIVGGVVAGILLVGIGDVGFSTAFVASVDVFSLRLAVAFWLYELLHGLLFGCVST